MLFGDCPRARELPCTEILLESCVWKRHHKRLTFEILFVTLDEDATLLAMVQLLETILIRI
jgi:hypothetical protein